jgi:hypothetical protein
VIAVYSHFDLDTAVAYCVGSARLVAFMITMCVRDGADRLTIGPDPRSRVVGVEVTYSISGKRHQLVPPPIAVLPKILTLLRRIATGQEDECLLRLSGHEFAGCINFERRGGGIHATIELPLLPNVAPAAAALLAMYLDKNGLVEFEDDDFT